MATVAAVAAGTGEDDHGASSHGRKLKLVWGFDRGVWEHVVTLELDQYGTKRWGTARRRETRETARLYGATRLWRQSSREGEGPWSPRDGETREHNGMGARVV